MPSPFRKLLHFAVIAHLALLDASADDGKQDASEPRAVEMQSRFSVEWDANALARAFGVGVSDVEDYLTDGRHASFMLERRLRSLHSGWTLLPTGGGGHDLLDPDGGQWEVRSVTDGGVHFSPSSQVGSGRDFEERGFRAKVEGLRGYILCDITVFPRVDVHLVPVEQVEAWHAAGDLGPNARISRRKFLALAEGMPD